MSNIPNMLLGVVSFFQIALAEGGQTRPEPVAAFIEHCYDSIRLTGLPKRPSPESNWVPADESIRAALDIEMPSEPLLVRPVADGAGFMLLQMRDRVLTEARGADRNERRQSCRIVYEGPNQPERSLDALENLFGLRGYDDPIGLRHCGYEIRDDWDQWLWSDNPGKDDHLWKMYEGRRGRSGCLVATTDRYYRAMDLVHVRLMVKESAPELTILEINRTYRPDPDAPKPKPRVGVRALGTPVDQGDDEQRKEQDKER